MDFHLLKLWKTNNYSYLLLLVSITGVPKLGVANPSGVGMIIMWGHNEVMGLVGSLRYRQGMSVRSTLTRGKGHLEIQCMIL